MAISDEEKVDLLWKKFIYGVSKTETPDNKSPSNEIRPSPTIAYGNQIWINAKDIPATPPAASTEFVQVKTVTGEGATPLTMITDSSDAKAWRAFDNAVAIEDWIPFSFGPAYALKLWLGDPAVVDPAPTMLFLDGSGNSDEYFFDYKAGIIYFIGDNLPVGAASQLYIEGYRYIGPMDVSVFEGGGGGGSDCGNEIALCEPTDGDLTDPAISGTSLGVTFNKGVAVALAVETTVTDAIDGLNEIVGMLLPDPPPAFPSTPLDFTSIGNDPRLAASVTDNSTESTIAAGDSVARTTGDANSQVIAISGPGKIGNLSASLNELGTLVDLGQIPFDITDNAGTDTSLVVTNNIWYPTDTPGFWQAFDCHLSILEGLIPIGVNKAEIVHSQAGDTEKFFVQDDFLDNPTINLETVNIADTIGTKTRSSGVIHYAQGAEIAIQNIGLGNISGETYYGGDPLALVVSGSFALTRGTSTNPFTNTTKNWLSLGKSLPLDRQWLANESQNDLPVEFNQNDCTKLFQFNLGVTNVNGITSTNINKNILYLAGTPQGVVLEDSIPVIGILGSSGNGTRTKFSLPTDQPGGLTDFWDSDQTPQNHHATIVAGRLAHDQTDYSAYHPLSDNNGSQPNLDLSSRDGKQYATFKFVATGVSNFDIDIEGQITACYVQLVGITDDYSSTQWWSMMLAAETFGIPGDQTVSYPDANGSLGCATSSTVMPEGAVTGRYNCTFGLANSSDAAAVAEGSQIYVRFVLQTGDYVDSLRFVDPSTT